MNVATALLGPLIVPECRRAVGRGWLILVRMLAAFALVGVALVVVWWWWFANQSEPGYRPYDLLRGGTLVLEVMAIVIALVLAPAVMAGSLAGEKERGSLHLLLTTSATPREIVLGRLAAKMSQVLMILAAGLPALFLLAALDGLAPAVVGTLIALPAGVALGTGGLSAAASVLSRRGRDALMSVYLVILLVLLSQLALPFLPGWLGLGRVSPLGGEVVESLLMDDAIGPAWTTIGLWLAVGLVGVAVAAWRLRPSCLGEGIAAAAGRRARRVRKAWVPPVGDRPMLWKELFIERTGTLGRFGKAVGVLLIAYLGAGSLGLLAAIVAVSLARPESDLPAALGGLIGWLYAGYAATLFGFLLQLAVGLRAAVAIASERERDTWDSLLTSPLDGREIVVGKLWGSLYALRWLFAATLISWVACLILGEMSPREFVYQVALVLAVGAFLAAAGVRISLATGTATRSMSVTIGVWMAAGAAVFAASWVLAGVIALFWLFCWFMAVRLQLVTFAAGVWSPITIFDLQKILSASMYVVGTLMIASESRLRFDRIAGRMAGGEAQVAVDRLLHGEPLAPVRLGGLDGERPPGPSSGFGPSLEGADPGDTVALPAADRR